MYKLFLSLIIAASFHAGYAQVLSTKKGVIKFTSSTPLEDIKAENRSVNCKLDKTTGALEFVLLMKNFDFPNQLMEDHFNETYVESDKYPKASFKGNITDISKVDFTKDGSYKVNYTGKLTIKNVTKDVSGVATITVKGGQVTASCTDMKVKPADYNIVIPATAAEKIAKEVSLDIFVDFSKK